MKKSSVVFALCCVLMMLVPLSAAGEQVDDQPADAETMEVAEDESSGYTIDEIAYQARSGVIPLYMSPNFYGVAGSADNLLMLNDDIGVGFRIDAGLAYGVAVDDEDVAVGLRAFGGVSLKGEYRFGSGAVQPMVGLGAGVYEFLAFGTQAEGDDVGVLAAGGTAFGLTPQIGVDLGNFRLAGVSYLIFGGDHFSPMFGLELSGVVQRHEF